MEKLLFRGSFWRWVMTGFNSCRWSTSALMAMVRANPSKKNISKLVWAVFGSLSMEVHSNIAAKQLEKDELDTFVKTNLNLSSIHLKTALEIERLLNNFFGFQFYDISAGQKCTYGRYKATVLARWSSRWNHPSALSVMASFSLLLSNRPNLPYTLFSSL